MCIVPQNRQKNIHIFCNNLLIRQRNFAEKSVISGFGKIGANGKLIIFIGVELTDIENSAVMGFLMEMHLNFGHILSVNYFVGKLIGNVIDDYCIV